MNNYLCTQKQFHFENTIIYVHKNNSMNMKKKYFENTIIYVHKNNSMNMKKKYFEIN